MIKILVLNALRDEIYKTFKKDSLKVYAVIESLQENPHKGKVLGIVGNMSVRELRYRNFRIYFIIDSHKLILFSKNQIQDLLIRFVRMSDKNNQQKTIDEIKAILKQIGQKDFDE